MSTVKQKMRTVALLIPARNEEKYLPCLLQDILGQTYPARETEIILADSCSADSTRKLMDDFARDYAGRYGRIAVLTNEGRNQASGWNTCIRNTAADVVIRVDAHSRLPEDFIEKQMLCQNCGEAVTGGVCERIVSEPSDWSRTLLLAENSLFGSGISAARRGGKEKRYVSSVSHTAYRRVLFEEYGLFDHRLERTEDNELHYRLRKAGVRILQDPAIRTQVCIRPSLKDMLRQKYDNGYWVGVTAKLCPGCLSVHHFVPALFVAAVVLTSAAACLGFALPAAVLWAAYFAFAVCGTIAGAEGQAFTPYFLLTPLLFLLMHTAYGIGSWVGLTAGRVPD